MADDQSPKNSTIDDLVNELTKQKTSNPPSLSSLPSQSPSMPPRPSSQSPVGPNIAPQSKNPIPPPRPTPTTLPSQLRPNIPQSQPMPPKPSTPPVNIPIQKSSQTLQPSTPPATFTPQAAPVKPIQQSSPPPVVKEYRSSIRTMTDDAASINKGQKPAGAEFPRKFDTGKLPASEAVPKTPSPAPVVLPKPSSGVELGRAQKSAPLGRSITNMFKRDETVKPPKEVITPKPNGPSISVPPKRIISPMVIVVAAAVIVLGGTMYWFFVLRSPTVVVQSPTPTPSQTQFPQVRLSDIFQGVSSQEVSVNSITDLASFKNNFKSISIGSGEFKIVDVFNKEPSAPLHLKADAVLTAFAKNVPQNLVASLGQDSMVLAYGQKEFFDSKGQPKEGSPSPRLVMILEVRDLGSVQQSLAQWEATLAVDFKDMFNIDPVKKASQDFLDNSYRSSGIRYKNFPFPDQAIDYAFINALNGKTYLIVTGSRESMFATIDKLLGL